MTKELICINCPRGCRLSVEMDGQAVLSVAGNAYRRGKTYALQGAVCSMRVLTANMKAAGCSRPFSVRSAAPIPKARLLDCAAELRNHRPPLPIRAGDVILENILDVVYFGGMR